MMQRTNIYLDEDQLHALRLLAAEDRESVADLVRQAIDEYLVKRYPDCRDWGERFDTLVARIQRRVPADVTPEQIEADISAARQEVREAHRATRAQCP